jgi:nitrite reductase/ring-hydroxylating ferredoxin subunit
MTFRSIGRIEDLEDKVPVRVELGGRAITVVRDGECVFAVQDSCTHENTRLSEGWYENGAIECPEHGSLFDCRTGAVMSLPATEPLRVYPVRRSGSDIEVGGLDDPAP